MTEQEKRNTENVLRIARGYIAMAKKEAVKRGDFDASMRLATNEAKVEQHFREQGIVLD